MCRLQASFSMTNSSSQASQFVATTGGSSEFFSASVNYGYKLTRDWYSSLSYTYLQRNDSTGTVSANMVLVSLSYDFTLMGNPGAINKAAEQRARQRARELSVRYFRESIDSCGTADLKPVLMMLTIIRSYRVYRIIPFPCLNGSSARHQSSDLDPHHLARVCALY